MIRAPRNRRLLPPRPAGQKTVTLPGGKGLTFYPWISENFTNPPSDPVNLVFSGAGADARSIRQALFALDGNRTAYGMPNVLPFNCTWADAMGANQVAFGAGKWAGSVIQLECGLYENIRFHLRLFQVASDVVIANAHFEALIPGTTQHQVLCGSSPSSSSPWTSCAPARSAARRRPSSA